jgi:hypothetical protein
MSDVTKSGILLFVTVVVVVTAFTFAVALANLLSKPRPYDDSDGGSARSGFTVMTDNLTGCQYLYRNGAMQPRFDQNGKQICKKEQK